MKQKFTFSNQAVAKEFERLTADDVRNLAQSFLDEFNSPITKFAQNVGLAPNSVVMWLKSERKLGERSLSAIYSYIRGSSENFSKCLYEVSSGKNKHIAAETPANA